MVRTINACCAGCGECWSTEVTPARKTLSCPQCGSRMPLEAVRYTDEPVQAERHEQRDVPGSAFEA